MRNFESWCHVLLLDAWQRAGLFKEPGSSATVTEIAKLNSRVRGISALGHARMIQAALDILVSSGLLRHAPVALLHHSLQLHIWPSYQHCRTDLGMLRLHSRHERACPPCRRSDGTYTSAERISSVEIKQALSSLQANADAMAAGECQPISTNITLISKTMQAWPGILTGTSSLPACRHVACALKWILHT